MIHVDTAQQETKLSASEAQIKTLLEENAKVLKVQTTLQVAKCHA